MFEYICDELLEKARKANTKEEALEILRQGGVDLTDADLKNIVGGEGDEGICWTHVTPCSWLCFEHHPDKCVSHCSCDTDKGCGFIM